MEFDFKAVVEDLEAVPEGFRSYYEPHDSGFALKTSVIQGHPALVKIKGTADRLDKEKRELARKLMDAEKRLADLPEDFDPEEYSRLKEAVESGDDKEREEARQQAYRKKLESLERKYQAEIAEREEALSRKESAIHKLLVEDGLTKALVEAGVGREYLKAAKALLKESVKVVEDGGTYRAIVDTDLGEVDLPKFVTDWTQTDEGKPFVPPPKGGDAKGSNNTRASEPNPWKPETRNLTQQSLIIQQDRAKAERMMRAAGVSEQRIQTFLGTR